MNTMSTLGSDAVTCMQHGCYMKYFHEGQCSIVIKFMSVLPLLDCLSAFERCGPVVYSTLLCKCKLTHECICAAYQWDYVFDWTVLKYQQSQATRRVHREPAAAGNNTTPEEDEEGRIK